MAAVRLAGVLLPASLGLFGGCADRVASRAPPIRSIDRTLPASAFGSGVASLRNGCFEVPVGPGVGPVRKCRPTREALAARPRSPLTPVHLLAELSLDRPHGLSRKALFAVYESRGLGACFTIVSDIALEELSCAGDPGCARVCLRPSVEERSASLGAPATGAYMLLAGTVPKTARAVRLRFPDGTSQTYALRGPLAKGLAGRRIFIVDLGRRRKAPQVELLR